MTQIPTRRRGGPRKLYEGVGRSVTTVKLTPNGLTRLAHVKARTGLKAGDLFEYLLLHYGERVPTGLLQAKYAAT